MPDKTADATGTTQHAATNDDSTSTSQASSGDATSAAQNDAASKDADGTVLGDQKDASTAPEKYETFRLPEGLAAAGDLLEAAVPVFKELGLSQDEAQRVVDLHSFVEQRKLAQHQAQVKAWGESLKSDPIVGGVRYEANVKSITAAMARFGDDELRQVLNSSGLGNHPALVRFVFRVAQAFAEGSVQVGKASSTPTPEDILRARYPSMYQENPPAA